ncbi:hypothetical protein IAT38_005043 [Cryptococcus sp. DSM 104549]
MIRLRPRALRLAIAGGRSTHSSPSASCLLLRATGATTSYRASQATPRLTRPPSTPLQPHRLIHTTPPLFATSPFKLFDIGEGITEVEILKWHVTEGQEVQEFDAICEVQSDKSVVELTSHATGAVKGIRFEVGNMVKVGQTLCDIITDELSDEGEHQLPPEQPAKAPAEPAETNHASLSGSGHLSGEAAVRVNENEEVSKAEEFSEELERAAEAQSRPPPPPSSPAPAPKKPGRHPLAEPEGSGEEDTTLLRGKDASMDSSGPSRLSGEAAILPTPPAVSRPTHTGPVEEREAGSDELKTIVKASPAVRTLAAKFGVDLAKVKGTGQGGRVLKDDVLAGAGDWVGDMVTGAGIEKGKRAETAEITKVEFGRTRKVMWRALGEQAKVPHFGYSHTLNLTPLLPYLKASKPQAEKPPYLASDIPASLIHDPLEHLALDRPKNTLLSFMVKALLLAMEEHPIMRSRVKESGDQRWLEVSRDGLLGIAVSDPKSGLLTPSLPKIHPSTPLSQITSHLAALRLNASRPTPPGHLTISSVGGLGEATGAMPVLPPGGGLAICAVGRAKWEVEWAAADGKTFELDEETVKRGGTRAVLRAPVGWSADHRVLEGAELIAFTETWKKYIEEPWRWIKAD